MVDNTFRWPDFFIVGAPKCGTTAFASYLSERTDVIMSVPKEPHYFCTDLHLNAKSRPAHTLELYKACFKGDRERARVGEASVFYLHSQDAIPSLLAKNPRAKIFVFLRNPVDMAISLHQQFVCNMWENLPFEAAWECSVGRKRNVTVPLECPSESLLNYHQLCLLGQQVRRVLTSAPRGNIQFILFDWIRDDPREVYLRMLSALDLEDDSRVDFPVVNPAQRTRWPRLREVLAMMQIAKNKVGIQNNFGMTRWIRRVNLKRVDPHKRISEDLRCEMRKVFREDVILLESLTGLPVTSMWGFD